MKYGRGLKSIRVRFTLLVLGLFLVYSVFDAYFHHALEEVSEGTGPVVLFVLMVVPGLLLTYWMTGKLTRPIRELKKSTDAIARGDYGSAVDVECDCEVGGLADSFRSMVDRLNSNVATINTLAFKDSVTGLPNRAVLARLIEKPGLFDGAVLFIDLDRFKQVNDTLGHQAGDAILGYVAERIQLGIGSDHLGDLSEAMTMAGEPRDFLPDGAYLFRFAGDEFVILMNGTHDLNELALLADRIVDALDEPFEYASNKINIGATIGISIFGQDSKNTDELIKFADIAMYEAKSERQSSFAFFNAEMRENTLARARLESELRDALHNHEFEMYYQPKLDIKSGVCVGVEALVRWNHPRMGLLMPGDFMDVVDSSFLVVDLGREVARLVGKQAKRWQSDGLKLPISMNVCATMFINPRFADEALELYRQSNLPTSAIELELTETVAMKDPVMVRMQLQKLVDAGVSVAVDDYGIGYSNLEQLYKLPFHALKLDKSLIDSIAFDRRSRTIVEATIRMAHALGHEVVAEGVESMEQFDVLAELGCDQAQGFLLSRPMSSNDLRLWLLDRRAA